MRALAGQSSATVAAKLYGREPHVAEALAKLECARQGVAQCVLLQGSAGIGKSALLAELRERFDLHARLVVRKFDLFASGPPQPLAVHVCRELTRSILSEALPTRDAWKDALLEALGPHRRLVVDLVPELGQLLGPQPEPQPLGRIEPQHCLELALQRLVEAVASAECPLVFLLDDLHWAGADSLRVIHRLVASPRCRPLLLIGTYCDTALGAASTLLATLTELRRAGVSVNQLELGPLGLGEVCSLLVDALHTREREVRPLAELVLHRTRGNPLLIGRYLARLCADQLLVWDTAMQCRTWDLGAIERTAAPGCVNDLLCGMVQRLPRPTQRLLGTAACLGGQFEVKTLSTISSLPAVDVVEQLRTAVREGVVLPLHKAAPDHGVAASAGHGLTATSEGTYEFVHDAARQASHAMLDEPERAAVHVQIGRQMLAHNEGEPGRAELLAAVVHLNLGRVMLDEPRELQRLAELNLGAGRYALGAAACTMAAQLLGTCLSLLRPDPWSVDCNLAHDAHLLGAECEWSAGNAEQALRLLDAADCHGRTTAERISARTLKILVLLRSERHAEAVTCGLETARMLGANLPEEPAAVRASVGARFGAIQALLGSRSIELLADRPPLTDPSKLALLEVLARTTAAAQRCNQDLMALLVLEATELLLRHGNAQVAPYFYECYGMVHALITGDYDTAYRFGRLGIELGAEQTSLEVSSLTHLVYATVNSHWREPLAKSVDHLRTASELSFACGDPARAALCQVLAIYHRYYLGESLPQLEAELARPDEWFSVARDSGPGRLRLLIRRLILGLQGLTDGAEAAGSEDTDKTGPLHAATGDRALLLYQHVHEAILRYFAGDFRGAVAEGDAARPTLPGLYLNVEHAFYRALALAGQLRTASPGDREPLIDALSDEEVRLRIWAESAPANHSHRHALVAAELAAVTGATERAMELYEDTIALAQVDGSRQVQALANELCAEFHLRRGRSKIARVYMTDAFHAYRHWGATAKLKQLQRTRCDLVAQDAWDALDQATRHGTSSSSVITSVRSATGPGGRSSATIAEGGLDLVTAIRATQAIAGELDLDRVLERLLRVLIENAGAERGILVLQRDGLLQVEGSVTLDPDEVRLNLREPLQNTSQLAASVVQYVARTGEPVVLDDVGSDPRFAGDPYVVASRPRSLLCVPMRHHGRLTGVLYLENSIAIHAFLPARVQLLQFLAAQAAVAVENAKLYGEVASTTEQLRQVNETLGAEVAQRTADLQGALGELWGDMDLAHKIRSALLPAERSISDYQIAAVTVPAPGAEAPYYDVVGAGDTSWLLMADAPGSGVAIGLGAVMLQTAVRTVLAAGASYRVPLTPTGLLRRVQAAVRPGSVRIGMVLDTNLCALRLHGGSVTHAGPGPGILAFRTAESRVERICTPAVRRARAKLDPQALTDQTFAVNPGDILLIFTDTLMQGEGAAAGQGSDRLHALFEQVAARCSQPETIVRDIQDHLNGRRANVNMTLLAVRYARPSRGR